MQITDLGDFATRFIDGLDRTQPNWFIAYATQQELADFTNRATDNLRGPTFSAHDALRRDVARRLMMPLRAALLAGLIQTEF